VSGIGQQSLTNMMNSAHDASTGALLGMPSGDEMPGETRMWVVGTIISNYELNGQDMGGQGGVGITRDFGNGFKLGGGVFSGARSLDTEHGGNQRTFALGPGVFLAYAPEKTGWRTEIGGMLQYTELDLKRGYINGAGTSTSMGNTDAMVYGLSGRVGYAVPLTDRLMVEPFGQYLWNRININSYTEKNGPFPASFDKQSEDINKTRAGAEFSYALNAKVTLTASGAWVHRFEDRSAAMGGTLTGVSAFNYAGNLVDKDWGEASVGAKWKLDAGTEAFVRVGNSFEKKGSGESDLNAVAGLSWPL
jgi:Autotransporter protein or domain, integral membrane beta-barrel involved in protein secretion